MFGCTPFLEEVREPNLWFSSLFFIPPRCSFYINGSMHFRGENASSQATHYEWKVFSSVIKGNETPTPRIVVCYLIVSCTSVSLGLLCISREIALRLGKHIHQTRGAGIAPPCYLWLRRSAKEGRTDRLPYTAMSETLKGLFFLSCDFVFLLVA